MTQEFEPFGVVEKGILERMALHQIRLVRAASFEAQDLASRIRPRKREREVEASSTFDELDLKLEVPTVAVLDVVEDLMKHHKYTMWLTNNHYRELHELERLRRMRKGDHVPAPMSVDVNVHAERRGHRSNSGVRIPPNGVTDPRWPAPVTIEAVNVGDFASTMDAPQARTPAV
jgi:hypothetical protein